MSFGSTPAATTQPPRVFISWSHEPDPHSEAAVVHRCRVLELADQLRAGGVDAQLDLYDPHPPEGWPAWMSSGIEGADFILIVCTTTYLQRWKREFVDGKGLGVRWEGLNLRNLLYREPARQARVIPILFEGASPSDIPLEVAGASRRRLPAEYDDLYRHLTNQPAISKPALGQLHRAVDNIPAPARTITGREEELALIDAGLARGGATALVQAISGLGGVGKTRIALEYAHTRAAHYELRWWAYAHRLDNDLAELARALGIVATDDDIDRAAKAAGAYLRNHSRWLLVIDNADDPEQLRPLLPTLGPGHVLITSRVAAWYDAATPIEINVLPADVARQLLLDRSRRPDDGHAADVARTLGYLPLALVQAAAYLENSRDTFADYLPILRSDGLDLFDDPLSDAHDPLHRDPVDAHRRTVARTWRPSIEAVRSAPDHGPAAAALLDFLAFFDPDGFPLALLHDEPNLLPAALRPLIASKRALSGALALLQRYSLIDRDGDRVRIHRLVQQVTRDALATDQSQALAAEVVTWARHVFAYNPHEPRISAVPTGIAAQLLALGEHTGGLGEGLPGLHASAARPLRVPYQSRGYRGAGRQPSSRPRSQRPLAHHRGELGEGRSSGAARSLRVPPESRRGRGAGRQPGPRPRPLRPLPGHRGGLGEGRPSLRAGAARPRVLLRENGRGRSSGGARMAHPRRRDPRCLPGSGSHECRGRARTRGCAFSARQSPTLRRSQCLGRRIASPGCVTLHQAPPSWRARSTPRCPR
ncbi:MAG: toll/interleukin-1 receptor domain-containing protein [Nannocystis sp.]|nr:toll/interleukin-1 receptor domain-containing protein [Nannocystis sp.]